MKEVLKLALEALETADEIEFWNKQKEAIAAIKEALAQPAQEPVAWGFRHDDGEIYDCISPEAHADCEGEYTVPLYATPPAAQPALLVQEPKHLVNVVIAHIKDLRKCVVELQKHGGFDETAAEIGVAADELEAALAAPPAAQEPDELTIAYMSGLYDGKKKRPWVGLTDEEFNDAINYKLTPRCIAIAIEAKLKEKNT
jgi:hypothetical protein